MNEIKISVDKLPFLLKNDYQFIDLRDPYEFKQLHLMKFINIPYENFNPINLHLSKNIPIILLCYSGVKSLNLAKELRKQGYQAYSIDGGFYTIKYAHQIK